MIMTCYAALIPLDELKEINFSRQYGLTYDQEVIDILDTLSRTKGVGNESKHVYTYNL